jgi:CHAT domain-containing protein
MEQGQAQFKDYFLGKLSAEEIDSVELQILENPEFAENMEIAETNLIEEYLDGELAINDQKLFEENYLTCEPRLKKVEFLKSVKKFAKSQSTTINETMPSFFETLKNKFNLRPLTLAFGTIALICAVGITSYFVWKNSTNKSETLLALNDYQKQKNERPLNSRISDFDYAPKVEGTRGTNDKANDDLDLVELSARTTVKQNPTAENLHALGQVYLTKKDFDKAIEQFEKAIKQNPNISKLHNDLGVALLEKGKIVKAKCEEKTKQKQECENEKEPYLLSLAKANEEFAKAIELDKTSLEANFNQALCIQELNLPNQAKEAWKNYLNLDSNSKWADEARKNLGTIETQKPISKNKDEILRDFLAAKDADDDEKAWQVLSRNREMITGKLIPQQLTFLFVDSKTIGDEATAKIALDALVYAGKLEEEKSGDLFWRDLARYYENVSDDKILILKQAQDRVRKGYELHTKRDYSEALNEFNSSSQLFLKCGSFLERELSNSHIANCLENLYEKPNETKDEIFNITNEIIKLSKKRNYKLLGLLSVMRITSMYNKANEYSNAINSAEKSYQIAEMSKDLYNEQRILGMIASLYSRLGEKKKAIIYTQKIFTKMNAAETGSKQNWRNYFNATELFASVKYHSTAKMLVKEEVLTAEQIGEPSVLSISQAHAGIIFSKTHNFSEAREFLNEGLQNAKKIPGAKSMQNLTAYCLLKSADLEQELGNYEEASRLYSESFKINNSPYFEFEIQKGMLRSFLALGNNEELEKQIPKTIEIAEENRAKIFEEKERNGFFHNENTVFDTAIEWEFGRGNYEKSYNYAEGSAAKSLLESLEKGKLTGLSNEKNDSLIRPKTMSLSELRTKIPEDIQLVQYAVLNREILIWLISKDTLTVKHVQISFEELQNKVENFIRLTLEDKSETSQETVKLSEELFLLLIQPVYADLNPHKQICLIPNKVLFFLPFSALRSEKGKMLLEEFVLFYAPSANIFVHCTKNAERKASQTIESILSIGNPKFDSQAFFNLPSLELAETEAKVIAGYYDKSITLLNKTATKKAFQKSIENADILHFAGHYLVKPDLPMSSSLLFAKDGDNIGQSTLSNAELSNENLKRIKLVVMSSCDTGIESYLNGEGMIGLSRTFLAADVPLVVASQWKVDSEATAALMENFHRIRREQKLPTVVALRHAQLEMMKSDKFKAPYYWAAFAVFGGYSKF